VNDFGTFSARKNTSDGIFKRLKWLNDIALLNKSS